MLEGAREVEEERERLCGLGLDVLLTCTVDYIMAVKSGWAGAFRKSFGKCGLEPLHACRANAIFAWFGSVRLSEFGWRLQERVRRVEAP
jgi:hypothetical protein